MSKLEITIENAKKAYQDGSKETRKLMEQLFGSSVFKTSKNWEEIKSFELACEQIGVDPVELVKNLQASGYTDDEIAYKKLKLVISVINGTWVPDYTNSNQRKWSPYFNCQSGFGFQNANAGYGNSHTDLGSRLVLETEKKAIHMGTYFLSEYKSFLM